MIPMDYYQVPNEVLKSFLVCKQHRIWNIYSTLRRFYCINSPPLLGDLFL